ncbi:MAG: hypothetical protein GXY34_11580 [Syntrophomonadaceae bacterium]|nr:hypothetical protein [Syntrophomonadaceae bacterium]
MNVNVKRLLWILLAVTLVLSCSGAYLRLTNEKNNKTVVTAVDYLELQKMADSAAMDLEPILDRLQKAGINTLGIKELSLRQMAYNGQVYLAPLGQFMSLNQLYQPQIWKDCAEATAGKQVGPDKLVVTSDQLSTISFLRTRLSHRFLPEQIIEFTSSGKTFFILNAELVQLDKPKDTVNKQNTAFQETDARLGFDDQLISHLKARGFSIILRPDNNTAANLAYLKEYEKAIRDNDVETIIFANEVSGAPDNLGPIEKIVEQNNMTVGIIETSVQLKYVEQKGLTQLIQDTNYPINRVYSSTNDEYVQEASERYYRWVRAVVDRSNRILYVTPFKDAKLNYSENMENTLQMLERFQSTIQEMGFDTTGGLQRLNPEVPGRWHYLMVSLSLLFGVLLYLAYLARPSLKVMAMLFIVGLTGCLGANLILSRDFSQLYALAAAILYPTLSTLMLLIYLRDNPHHSLIIKMFCSLAIILVINMAGAFTVVTSMADIRYIMNVEFFRGVKLAFLVPLLLFILNYFVVFSGDDGFRQRVMEVLKMQPTYLALLAFLIVGAAGYYYLVRSGNTTAAQISTLELRFRETLETWFMARPRFKEFLIAYPALFAMVYLYHRYKHDFILLMLGLGVVIGSVSMVNSFCHGFTAITVSASRTVGGLLVGMVTVAGTLIGIWILEQIWKRIISVR